MYNNKTYRVDYVSWDETPLTKFKLQDGRDIITYQDSTKSKATY